MPTAAPTIYDIAKAAGVSPSTVSRAFARPGRVSFSTAERIRKVAEELGYQSTKIERPVGRSKTRTGTIALVVADIGNPVFIDLIKGAEEEAARNGYTMLLANTRESGTAEREALERSLDIVDGIVLSSSRMTDSAIRAMAKQKATIVANRGVQGVSSIATDNAGGIKKILAHLNNLGHKNVLYLAGPAASWANGVRWTALKRLAPEFGMTIHAVETHSPTVEGGAHAAPKVLTSNATAIIGYNDQVAIGVMRQLIKLGHDVPNEYSVVGFDNSSGADLVTPGLTSVAAPLDVLGSTAVKNLLALARGAVSHQESAILLPTKLVVRDSTGPTRRKSSL